MAIEKIDNVSSDEINEAIDYLKSTGRRLATAALPFIAGDGTICILCGCEDCKTPIAMLSLDTETMRLMAQELIALCDMVDSKETLQ